MNNKSSSSCFSLEHAQTSALCSYVKAIGTSIPLDDLIQIVREHGHSQDVIDIVMIMAGQVLPMQTKHLSEKTHIARVILDWRASWSKPTRNDNESSSD